MPRYSVMTPASHEPPMMIDPNTQIMSPMPIMHEDLSRPPLPGQPPLPAENQYVKFDFNSLKNWKVLSMMNIFNDIRSALMSFWIKIQNRSVCPPLPVLKSIPIWSCGLWAWATFRLSVLLVISTARVSGACFMKRVVARMALLATSAITFMKRGRVNRGWASQLANVTKQGNLFTRTAVASNSSLTHSIDFIIWSQQKHVSKINNV